MMKYISKFFGVVLCVICGLTSYSTLVSMDCLGEFDKKKTNIFLEITSKNKKSNKNIVKVFKLEGLKLILKKEFEKEVLYYQTYKSKNCELITFIFFDEVRLYDLQTGNKITEIKLKEEIISSVVNDKDSFIILSANNRLKAIELKDKSVFWRATLDKTITGGLSIWRYLALAFLSRDKKRGAIGLLDVEKKEKNLIRCFKLDSKNYYGFYKGIEEFYFWIIDHGFKSLYIYNLYPGKFKPLLSKKFGKKVKKFNIKKSKHTKNNTKYARIISINFCDGTTKKFGVLKF